MLKKPDLMDFLPKQGGAKPAQPEAPKPQYKTPVSPIVTEIKKNQDATKAKAEASYQAELKRKAQKAVQVPVHTKYGTAYSPQKGWELLTPDQKKAELSRLRKEIEETEDANRKATNTPPNQPTTDPYNPGEAVPMKSDFEIARDMYNDSKVVKTIQDLSPLRLGGKMLEKAVPGSTEGIQKFGKSMQVSLDQKDMGTTGPLAIPEFLGRLTVNIPGEIVKGGGTIMNPKTDNAGVAQAGLETAAYAIPAWQSGKRAVNAIRTFLKEGESAVASGVSSVVAESSKPTVEGWKPVADAGYATNAVETPVTSFIAKGARRNRAVSFSNDLIAEIQKQKSKLRPKSSDYRRIDILEKEIAKGANSGQFHPLVDDMLNEYDATMGLSAPAKQPVAPRSAQPEVPTSNPNPSSFEEFRNGTDPASGVVTPRKPHFTNGNEPTGFGATEASPLEQMMKGAEPAQSPTMGKGSSTANIATDADRTLFNMAKREAPTPETASQWAEQAKTVDVNGLIREIGNKPRVLEPHENFALAAYLDDIKVKRAEVQSQIAKHTQDGTPVPPELTALDNELEAAGQVGIETAVKAGTPWGRSGAARAMIVANDYTPQGTVTKGVKASEKRGVPLTPEENKALTGHGEQYVTAADHEAAVSNLQKQLSDLQKRFQDAGKQTAKGGGSSIPRVRTEKAKVSFDAELQAAKDKIQKARAEAMGSAFSTPIVPIAKLTAAEIEHVARVVKAHAKLGWASAADFAEATVKMLKAELGVEATNKDALDLFRKQVSPVNPRELADNLTDLQKLKKEVAQIYKDEKLKVQGGARDRKLAQIQADIKSYEDAVAKGVIPQQVLNARARKIITDIKANADIELQSARLRKQNAKDAADVMVKDIESTKSEKFAQGLVKYQRASILSSVSVFGKLVAATAGHAVVTPVEELIAPLVGKVVKGAGTEAMFSPKAEFAAMMEFLKKDTYADAYRKLRTGYNSLDLEAIANGVKTENSALSAKAIDKILAFEQNSHGAFKTPLQRSAYAREYVKQLQLAKKMGSDPLSPQVRLDAQMAAYLKSKESILMGDNAGADAIMKALLAVGDKSPFAAAALKSQVPITRVPMNFAGRSAEYVAGVPIGLQKHITGTLFKSLTDADRAAIARAYKRGGVGTGLAAAAYLSKDKANIEVDAYGHMSIAGVPIPSALQHIPWVEALKMGAIYADSSNGLSDTVAKTASGIAYNVPGFEQVNRWKGAMRSGDSLGKMAGKITSGLVVPQIVQQAGKALDGGQKKKTEGFRDEIQNTIPILRRGLEDK